MYKIFLSIVLTIALTSGVKAQEKVDSSLYYDDLFSELESFLDSLTQPRTMVIVNAEAGSNYLNYTTSSVNTLAAQQKITLSPSIGYFHKSGLGISGSAAIIRENEDLRAYQFLLSASYDYLKSRQWGTGLSLSRFFTKDSLQFYTSPLQNEASFYVAYKGWWIRPSVSATYGWGSRTNVEERKNYIKSLRLRAPGSTVVNTEESISDFSVATSLKHDFYWLEKLGKNNVLRFTPQITFTSGTQNYGFNQTTTSYALRNNKTNILANAENVNLDDELKFQALSLTSFLKGEISFGKLFIQPQLIVDYYFPAKENNLTTGFRLNVGVSL